MNRINLILALLALGAGAALAQGPGPTPTAEVGLNFSLTNFHPGNGAPSFVASGGSASLVYNFNQFFGAVADLGSYHNPGDSHYNPTTFTYLFGPRLSIRKSRATPYVQALFGGARQWTSFVDPVTGDFPKQDGFAAAFGGGLDIRVKDHILLKPFQLEYLMTQLNNPWSTTGTQNNLRYSAGVVFTFGSE